MPGYGPLGQGVVVASQMDYLARLPLEVRPVEAALLLLLLHFTEYRFASLCCRQFVGYTSVMNATAHSESGGNKSVKRSSSSRRRPAVEVSPVRLGRGGPLHSVGTRLEEGNADPRHRKIVRL